MREAIKRSLSYATNQYAIIRISLISLHVLGMWEIYQPSPFSKNTVSSLELQFNFVYISGTFQIPARFFLLALAFTFDFSCLSPTTSQILSYVT